MEIEEDYRNLSYKTLTAYQWIWQKYSPKFVQLLPNWIIKTDDDINVDWIEFLARLDSQNNVHSSLICHYVLYNRYPIRNPHDKL